MRSLRAIVLQRIMIVATVSFMLSAGFTYYYYRTVFLNQMIHDDRTKLRQTARQLQYMSDDISQFASSLIISRQLQTFYKTFDKVGTFDKFALLQDTFNYLNDYRGLRKEVTSYTLVPLQGDVYWSASQYDDYYKQRMKEPWYQDYLESGKSNAFTAPHRMFFNARTDSDIISYIVQVQDIEMTGRVLGKFILNLDYGNFSSLLAFGSSEFDGFLWLDESGHVLYESGKGMPDSVNRAMREAAAATAGGGESVEKAGGGYLLRDRFAGNGWTLVSYTSGRTVIARGRFVLYLLAIFSLTSTALILLLMMPAIFRITRPIMRLYHAMNAASSGNLRASVTIRTGDELEKLGLGFNRMIDQLRAHLAESIRFEKEKKEMEMELLLSQLNPHFVYNTLNAVIYLARRHGHDDITRMVGSLIRILQDAVKTGGAQSLIPLREELALLRDYVSIQSYRYTDTFDVVWEIAEEAEACLIPRNLLQPIVENAIFHGICPKEARGTIRISARMIGERLAIDIADDGVGIAPDQMSAVWERENSRSSPGLRHIGLSNTRQRMEHLFDGKAELRIRSVPNEGTTVTFEIPARRAAPAEPRDTG